MNKIIVIGHLRHRTAMVEAILAAEEPFTRAVFLGGYFGADSVQDSVALCRRTARWLRVRMADPRLVFLRGGADPHLLPSPLQTHLTVGSGWQPQGEAVSAIIGREQSRRFHLVHRVGPWLLSHGGVRPRVRPDSGTGPEHPAAVERAGATVPAGLIHSATASKRAARLLTLPGGMKPSGDDERSFSLPPVAGVNQLFGGGGSGPLPRFETRENRAGTAVHVCLGDAEAGTYAVVGGDGLLACRVHQPDGRTLSLGEIEPLSTRPKTGLQRLPAALPRDSSLA